MKKKYKLLAVSLVTVLVFEVVAPILSAHRNYGVEYLSVISNVKADDVVGIDIEVPESLQEVALDSNQEIDIQNMNSQELESFEQLIQQEVESAELPTDEDTEAYKQTLLDFFDSDSNVYQNVEAATEQAIDEINDNHESVLDKIDGEKVLAASHGTISVKLLGSILNVVVAAAIGGAGGVAVKTYVRKYGVKRATDTLSRVLRDKLLKLGYKKGAAIGGVVGRVVTNFLDPGTAVAKFIDSQDKIKNNGWIELW